MNSALYSVIYYSSLMLTPFVVYSVFFRKSERSQYSNKDWLYPIKFFIAKKQVRKYAKCKYETLGKESETAFDIPTDTHTISQNFHGIDQKGNSLLLKFSIGPGKIAEIGLHLKLADGNSYIHPGNNGNGIFLDNLHKNQCSIGGVNIEFLEEFRKLRIVFNGLLTNISRSMQKKTEHVQFNFIFTAGASPSFIPHDIDETLLSNSLATQVWRDGSWMDSLTNQSGFVQFGAMKGFVRGDSYPEDYIMNLSTCRTRYEGIDNRFLVTRSMKIYIVDELGNLFNIVVEFYKKDHFQMTYGFAYLSNYKRYPIEAVDIRLKDIAQNKVIPEMITIHITVNGSVYKCVIHLNVSKLSRFLNDTEYGYEYFNVPAECNVNLNQGRALVEFWYQHEGRNIFIPERKLVSKTVTELPPVLVSNIEDEDSQILELTGGKGNSLALLASLNSTDFSVPDGFIITTQAYKLQLRSNPNLANYISFLNDICCGKKEGKLEEDCEKTVDLLKNDMILPEIVSAIRKELKKYSEGKGVPSWAVRSSAIGEDSEELSAAGQNETFLGCQNEEQILKAVTACWASLYTYQSVQYRWQHGLSVVTDMAVVVQKMVPADSAGVLFTCHPSTSNPSQMVVTSNFGIGETVVSGVSDPDTFVLSRSWKNTISLLEKNVGSKNSILAMTTDGSTEMYTEENNNSSWSLTDEQALQLGKVGILLEGAFGNPRDIEWAFYKDKLYLLQSRPITTLNTWTDFELDHEMDTPLLTEKSILSVGNTKEVIPRAATVLSQTSCMRCTNRAMQVYTQKNDDPISSGGLATFQHNIMIDVAASVHRNVSREIRISSKILDLAIFGHPVLDEKINEILVNRFGVTPALDNLKELYRLVNVARRNKDIVIEAKQLVDNLKLKMEKDESVLDMHKKIEEAMDDVVKVSICHTKVSSVVVLYQIIIMSILLEREKEITVNHLSDFSIILSSCEDVISAEVPQYLENISKMIKEQSCSEEFRKVIPELGVEWLEQKCPQVKKLLETFLKNHGHRSLGEFEVMEESWAENPTKVITMIQANIKHGRISEKSKMSLEDVVKNLVSPKSGITRKIVKFFIKRMTVSVGFREQTKSEMVRAFDVVRQAYRHLSQGMVRDGLLPSKQLIYHLTHEEIGKIIENRSPVLINKAMRRRKRYPKWDKLKFPEVMFGNPVPEDDSTIFINTLEKSCKGTPVCTGVVQARACVINNLEEIHQLETGDILITYSTDIGWSPYFPMLSGIVTELGGLISHGAVVAREYGLPCIVGMKNVTKYFKTGDIVLLNGKTGELGKM